MYLTSGHIKSNVLSMDSLMPDSIKKACSWILQETYCYILNP